MSHIMRGVRASLVILGAGFLSACEQGSHLIEHDIVLRGGVVMDPESGLNAVRDVGLIDGRIATLSETPLQGRDVVDVTGLVVAPGFIDLHAHGQREAANALQARDGVTTALELEAGTFPIDEAYAAREGKSILNFGYSVAHHLARVAAKEASADDGSSEEAAQKALHEPAYGEELDEILRLIARELHAGGLGIGTGIEYMPGVGRDEVFRLFELAAREQAPIFAHVRRSDGGDRAPEVEAQQVQEVLANAAATGAALHVCHVTSMGLSSTGLILDLIYNARARGVDVSTEAYPYTAGSTDLGSALFDPGWQDRLGGIGFQDLVWTATSERLTEQTFNKYRAQAQAQGRGGVIVHFIPESAMTLAIAHPEVMIASDGGDWSTGGEHPRGAGTYARVLGQYVRERGDLDLMTALRKMSLLPAQRLEAIAPEMKRKGRVQEGAAADIVVFDPKTVLDQATFENPMQPSIGILHVLVNGVFVIRDSELLTGVYPGRAVRGKLQTESDPHDTSERNHGVGKD